MAWDSVCVEGNHQQGLQVLGNEFARQLSVHALQESYLQSFELKWIEFLTNCGQAAASFALVAALT
jgi:hypothetical protein